MDYIEAFKNLKTNNKYSRKSPHKAVLLLSIIDLFESCILRDNIIKFDETLKKAFIRTWNKVLPNEGTFLPEAYLPFWFMQSEGFWHIVPLRGKEDILSVLRDTHIKPSESKLKDCVNYAELDEDLYFLMTVQSGRSSLKRALLETYTTLSPRMIDQLSTSSDNFVDNSEVAMSEFQSILNSSISERSSSRQHSDQEVEKRFYKLPEEIQYVFYIEYYTFLKKNINEREFFKEICPSVFDLYDRIACHPIRQGEISPSINFTYENFLSDLKISLMSEEGSFDTIDKINEAIDFLHEKEAAYYVSNIEGVENQHIQPEPEKLLSEKQELRPLTQASEDRRGKSWTVNEEELISLYFKQGYSCDAIASAMGRTEVSIKSRLASLGLIEYSYETDTYVPADKEKTFVSPNSEEVVADVSLDIPTPVVEIETGTIELTRELIEAARTPNGGFTKSQLAVLGISWPAPENWIDDKVGTFITSKQLEEFNHIEYVGEKAHKSISSFMSKGSKTYKDMAYNDKDRNRLEAVLRVMEHFNMPVSPRDVARTVSRSAWGGTVNEDSVDTILKRLPEVEYVPWGKYILKNKMK